VFGLAFRKILTTIWYVRQFVRRTTPKTYCRIKLVSLQDIAKFKQETFNCSWGYGCPEDWCSMESNKQVGAENEFNVQSRVVSIRNISTRWRISSWAYWALTSHFYNFLLWQFQEVVIEIVLLALEPKEEPPSSFDHLKSKSLFPVNPHIHAIEPPNISWSWYIIWPCSKTKK